MRPALPRAPDSRIIANLSTLFRFKANSDTVEDYLEKLSSVSWVNLPFDTARLRVVSESFSVLGGIDHPTPSTHLINYLTEAPDDPILVTDCLHQGPESLFFAQLAPDMGLIESWMRKMTSLSIYVNTRKGDTLVAAPVRAFAPL